MKHIYRKTSKLKFNDAIFQVVIREDNKMGFFKIVKEGDEEKYIYPSAYEFLHLSSWLNTNNRIKF